MSAIMRLLLALLLLQMLISQAAPAHAQAIDAFAGTWGGTWVATTRYGGSGPLCPNRTVSTGGGWTAAVSRSGDWLGIMNGDSYPAGTLHGTVTAGGTVALDLLPAPCVRERLVVQLGAGDDSAHARVSCTIHVFLSCPFDYELTLTGGRTTLEAAPANYEGLWWNSPAGSESGWGLNVTHQGDTLFATWFTYGRDGNGIWVVMPDGQKVANGAYAGTLYHTTGPAFDASPWDPAKVKRVAVGSAAFMFSDAANATFMYTLRSTVDFEEASVTQWKPITKLVFSSPVPTCEAGGAHTASPNYQDLWWSSPPGSESGWGVNITHQGDILFATWFTYDATRKGLWLVMSNGARTGPGTYTGALYRTTGSSYASRWDATKATQTQVGTATFTFADADNGVFSYVVNGIAQSKPITRLSFAAPATVCH